MAKKKFEKSEKKEKKEKKEKRSKENGVSKHKKEKLKQVSSSTAGSARPQIAYLTRAIPLFQESRQQRMQMEMLPWRKQPRELFK